MRMKVDVDIISFISGMCPTRTRVEGERGASAKRSHGFAAYPKRQEGPSGIPYL